LKRLVKLLINVFLASVYVTFAIAVLILILNPNNKLTDFEFLQLFLNLLVYYGPVICILLLFCFGIFQFFSYKRIAIGFFSPPSLIYFFASAALISSLIHYVNFEYFKQILSKPNHERLIEVIIADLVILVIVLSFSLSRKSLKLWFQLIIVLIVVSNTVFSYLRTQSIITDWEHRPKEKVSTSPLPESARKIRIVMMDGLSHRIVLSMLNRTDTLRNFQLLISNGVHGHVTTFKPNTDLLVISTLMSGLHPSQITQQDDWRFKVRDIDTEFILFPRYIFFRYSAVFDLTAFYATRYPKVVDRLKDNFDKQGLPTFQLLYQIDPPLYSSLALRQNNLFLQHFSYALTRNTPNFNLLKRTFFYDEYLRTLLPDLKNSNLYYAGIRIPGLSNISRRFYPYFDPQLSGNVTQMPTTSSYAPILESYYHYYDSIIGNLISTTRDDEMLVIFSTYELEQMPEWRRILYSLMGGEQEITMYKPLHSRAFIYMYEKKALKHDYPLNNVAILDIYPTLLYYAGFRLPKNLEGEVLRGIFTDEFISLHPINIDPGQGGDS